MKKFLSFDVGIVNLGYCYLSLDNDIIQIIEWGTINLLGEYESCNIDKCVYQAQLFTEENKLCVHHACDIVPKPKLIKADGNASKINIDCLREHLFRVFDSKPQFQDVDTILIENQPSLKNPKMKAMSNAIFDYFILRCRVDKNMKIDVLHISPINKTKIVPLDNIDGHDELLQKKLKKYAYTKQLGVLLCKNLLDTQCFNFLTTTKKVDDMSDAFLQAYHYIYIKKKVSVNTNITILV